MKETIKIWILPVIFSLSLFLMIRPVFAQLIENNLLDMGNIQVGSEIGENGFRQIYYLKNGEKHFISSRDYTSGEPNYDGDYITWMGQSTGSTWQIYLYHIPSDTTIQLTSSGNNANPMVSNGKVVWEGWVEDEDVWQVFFFDGISVSKLTSGDASLNPMIEGDNIVYARRDSTGQWRSILYSVSAKKAIEISFGDSSKNPRLVNGEIFLGEEGEKFALNVEDLILLGFEPLSIQDEVTIDDIAEEMEATVSAQVETESTLTPSRTPEFPSADEE